MSIPDQINLQAPALDPGRGEKTVRSGVPANWDDAQYLKTNPDVRAAIERREFESGYHHFSLYGVLEGRRAAWIEASTGRSPWPWSDSLYFQANPNLQEILVEAGLSAYDHYMQSGKAEGRQTGLQETVHAFSDRTSLPGWIASEMMELSCFEPALDLTSFPCPWMFKPDNKSPWCRQFAGILEYLRYDEYDFIFFVPWLKKGGADLAALYHIQAVTAVCPRVAVFTTEDAESEWADRVPETVDLVPLGKVVRGIEPYFLQTLTYHLIIALRPARLHIINSALAWNLLAHNPTALASITTIYVSLYCYDYDARGEPAGYARRLRRCLPGITAIYTDNTTFARHLIGDLGARAECVHVLAHPVAEMATSIPATPYSNRVLWASRLDRQKQPEIVVEIAQRMPGISFDVYGSGVMGDAREVIDRLTASPNITYCGPFDNLQQILTEEYRCFLYTSLWDGLPNILLEMMWAGMLVIAPDIGGIDADLGTDRLVLVPDPRNPELYVTALRWVFQNHNDAETVRLNGQDHVQARHTWQAFTHTLMESGYLPETMKAADTGPGCMVLADPDITSINTAVVRTGGSVR